MHKPKKSLGQNFLKSILAINKIIEAGELTDSDVVLEIGPGKGILTTKLLENAGQVIAVEKDRNLIELLKEKFKKEIVEGKLILIEDDILKFNIYEVIKNNFKNFNYKIIANIPYNITGAILKKFLTDKNQPLLMVLMVQNEVAKRIVARDGKESILSVSIKAYGEPKIVMKVPSRYFSPAPKVDSAVISIKNISRNIFKKENLDENIFWEIIHAGFSHKRKKLISNLKILPKFDHDNSKKYEEKLGNKRAEELSLLDWIFLAKKD
jgi:16S rRNA (adenine1518-N6/adenine1519-N6)-dimethyltransferase